MGRVLVVDDSSTARLKMSAAVRNLGHEVSTAGGGHEALKALQHKDFDVVLLDILMPEMDGFQVLAALKANSRTIHIPVIVVSSLSDTMSNVVRAMELGAEDFLPKDFELPLLKSRISAGLEKSFRRHPAPEVTIRPASPDDIPMLLSLINTAGAGLPLESWKRNCSGSQSPWQKGAEIMRDPAADIHYGNCWIAETESGGLGGLVFYHPPVPGSAVAGPVQDFFRPIYELEALGAGTGHISYLCTIDSWRGKGIGSALLRFAETRRGPRGMSVVVASSNDGARALYNRFGYAEVDRRPMIMQDGRHHGHDWILLFKS